MLDPYIQHVFQWKEGNVTDLGALPGGGSSCTQWINERGWIVGGSSNGTIDPLTGYPEVNATLWKNGRVINLGTLGGNQSLAWSVNDRGRVAGFALNKIPDPFTSAVFAFGATQARAVLWQDGVMRNLGTLGGPDSDALLVNERGQVAGMSFTNSSINAITGQPTLDPFFWEDGKMTDLGTLGGTYGYPNALNNRGQVVGFSDVAGDQSGHPFLWEEGVLKDLGTLGGSAGEARWINDDGDIAGYATLTGDHVVHAVLWREGKTIDLGVLPGSPCSYANGVDPLGQVLGALQQCPNMGPRRAFLWENGDMVDLNSLIPRGSDLLLTGAINGNGRGEIVVVGTLRNGEGHAALLIPDGDCEEDCEARIEADKREAASAQANPVSGAADSNSRANGSVLDLPRNRFGRRP
jgi:probable HAF family extracellular repeat protein